MTILPFNQFLQNITCPVLDLSLASSHLPPPTKSPTLNSVSGMNFQLWRREMVRKVISLPSTSTVPSGACSGDKVQQDSADGFASNFTIRHMNWDPNWYFLAHRQYSCCDRALPLCSSPVTCKKLHYHYQMQTTNMNWNPFNILQGFPYI